MISVSTNKNSRIQSESLFTYLGIGIAITLVWWPLVNSIFCILLFACWLFLADKDLLTKRRAGYAILFSSLYILALIGFFYSSNKEEALFRIQQKVPLLLFPLLFASSNLVSKQGVNKIIFSFSFSFALFCIYCICKGLYVLATEGNYSGLTGYNLIVLKDMYPFITGVFCVFCISFHFTKIKIERSYLIAHIFFIGLFWVMLLLLANIIALLMATIITLFFAFTLLKSPAQKIILFLFCVAAFSIAFNFNPAFKLKITAVTDFSQGSVIPLDADASLGRSWDGKALRIAIWKCSRDLIQNNFVFGLGTGDVQDELQKAYEQRKFYFASRYNRYNAHNQYIQQMLQQGLLGLTALISCVFIPLLYKQDSNKQYLQSFLFIFVIICFTESILEVNKGIIWYSFFNSIFVFSENRTES